ncbi:hypothetical protein A9G34_01760 [Gilliamella sp. Choc4-2]|jgi:hypothetical protein|uniref:hypothetical protein n=1 Tax=unclassified Gilliamella TaxID=2685620 RepID=UPI0004DCCC0C|nr:hypothetical protein [Gilliamella apicola]KFA59397.1 hypothetical protein GAPWKB11_0140 [Gilliamella apicola]OCG32014.1 hypothetical protein A9G33_04195 [Gilliamella apicola]OCG45087.1 hypothetical protein A9G34_01760 [Gilliamella apicola]OCG54659.1 hypothetical protein A9G36_07430 [Gilliamella apicola]OCG65120.1 hypothetical protein A9G48_00850 [Gilliamella apicola]
MKTHKKPLFTLVQRSESVAKQKTLSYLETKLDYPDRIDDIIALRIKELKLHHTEYKEKEYNEKNTFRNNKEFSFIFGEVFESEHHEKQIGMLKDDIALAKESNKVKKLLGTRLKEMAKIYPDVKLDLNDVNVMPTKIKEHLFAPPLILTEDNAIMLWDD